MKISDCSRRLISKVNIRVVSIQIHGVSDIHACTFAERKAKI